MTVAVQMQEHRAPGPVLVAVGLVLVLVLSACGVEVTSRAASGPLTNPDISGGQETTAAPTVTTSTTLPPTDLVITGDTGAPVNNIAANAIVDLQAYWSKTFPEVYGSPYQPVAGGFYAIDRNSNVSELPCQPSDINQVLNNAYYCGLDDAVAWDQENLMPSLAEEFGNFVVAVVLAHEWGHAIQQRAGFEAPTVVMELQADCFAGSWVKHVQTDRGNRFTVTTEALDQALAGVLSLRDAPGGEATDPNAHGSGFDRVGAFQEGFEQGPQRCKAFTVDDPKPFLFRFPAGQTGEKTFETAGDLPLDQIETEAFSSLDAFWADAFPTISGGKAWTPMNPAHAFSPDDPPTCNGKVITQFRLFLCVPDRYVGYDDTEIIPAAYEHGDFAVATLFATQYGLEVQDQLKKPPGDEVTATLRGDCYSGAWAGALLPTNQTPAQAEKYRLSLSPGDLDEGLTVLLTLRTESDRQRQGPGFDRALAFRAGVLGGPAACVDLKPS